MSTLSVLPANRPEPVGFIHLRQHTEFSVQDGINPIADAIGFAAKDAQPALAITDLNNLFGAIKFYKSARKAGIKPIVGAEIWLEDWDSNNHNDIEKHKTHCGSRWLLLVQNTQGYLNLCEILTRAWTRNTIKNQAVCTWAWLQELNGGLLLLSGAQSGAIGQALLQGDQKKAHETAKHAAQWFENRFYLEIQRTARPDDETHILACLQLANFLQLPIVATHPIQFLTPAGYEAHEARICIADGDLLSNTKRVRRFTTEQHFKTTAEMQNLFADIPSALQNSVEIAKRCNLHLVLGKPQLPIFPTPLVDGVQLSPEAYFKHACNAGLQKRLMQLQRHQSEWVIYQSRLDFEINTILSMGFPGYFLIVSDFINWAKNNACPVGPGRGSGAGSLVAYALNITDLDPLQYNLLFERFLNPERVSMPDFDIDFCQANRDRVIDYVKLKYGKEAVSQIVTFGTMAARGVVRDVGRVLEMGYMFCDGISKLIPNKPGLQVSLQIPPEPHLRKKDDKNTYAVEAEPILAQREADEEDVKTLLTLARQLEGITRNIGMHAGGVLIAPGKLTDFCPLYQQIGSDSAVSQFDKNDVEDIGLVKFDFLGLATLTILELARQLIVQNHPNQTDFNYETLPLDDDGVFRLFAQGKTEAVFQFESRGMQGMLKDAKPTRLEDLIALNALYRPGPMDLIPSFVARKHGREEVDYPHPLVAGVLSETYGIMVYQEQVMQTAQILGGYSLGGADMLRRAMGKKDAEEMARHRLIFQKGAAKNDITSEKADEIFDLMEKFAGYGFNKSHAAAYSLLAYHTAWLKVHYTAEFFCANMTQEMGDTDKIKILHADAKIHFGLDFSPPCVNHSGYNFAPETTNTNTNTNTDTSNHKKSCIRYGLGALKGAGQQAIEAIVLAREQHKQPFTSLFDFCVRVEKTKINKRTIEALIKSGAFDSLHTNRASVLASVDLAVDFANAMLANANQNSLFDDESHGASNQEPELVATPAWDTKTQLMHEKSAMGFFFSGHLFDAAAPEVRQFAKQTIADVTASKEGQLLAGIVTDFRFVNTPRGKLGLFKLDDGTGQIESSVDEKMLVLYKNQLQDDALLVVRGTVQTDRFSGGSLRLKLQQVWDMTNARAAFGRCVAIPVQGKMPAVAQWLSQWVTSLPPSATSTHNINNAAADTENVRLPLCLNISCEHPQLGTIQAGLTAPLWLLHPTDDALHALCDALGQEKSHVRKFLVY